MKMSQLASKRKYFPNRVPKTTSSVVHWKLFVVVNKNILLSLNPLLFSVGRERTIGRHKPTHESGGESLAESGKKPGKYLGER